MRTLLSTLAIALFAILHAPDSALAGHCPEVHQLQEPRELEKMSGKGVKVEIREQVDLTGWRGMGNFRLRIRHFVIEPGGVVPVHQHGDRPAIIYFVSGEIFEHHALCAEPILHKPGESSAEFGADHQHWWSNESDETVVLISADVVPFTP